MTWVPNNRALKSTKERTEMEKLDKPKQDKPEVKDKKGRRNSDYTAEEKCRAVLSVWTEKRKPGEICREMGVAWTVLNQWQERAMEGMLLALQPRVAVEKAVALTPRLAVLLEGAMKGLERRLTRLQSKTRVKERSPDKPEESKERGA